MFGLRKRRKNKKRKSAPVRRALLKIDGRSVEIVLRTNPRARRFIVKVDPATGEVSVVAPSARSLESALDFARGEKEWISQHLAEIPASVPLKHGGKVLYRGEIHTIEPAAESGKGVVWQDGGDVLRVTGAAEHCGRRVSDWLKREARRVIDARVAHYGAKIGVKPKKIMLRDTSSRWGSCSSNGSLSFSWRLILAPPFVLEYVVAHEVCHLIEMNHDKPFWKLVHGITSYTDRAQAWLAANGPTLHAYAPKGR